MRTKQQIFDFIYTEMIKQGEPSVKSNVSGSCRYRSINAEGKICKCAIGFIIPDSLYDHRIEGRIIMNLRETGENDKPETQESVELFNSIMRNIPDIPMDDEMIEFYSALQSCHDTAAIYAKERFISEFQFNMRELAYKYNLSKAVFP